MSTRKAQSALIHFFNALSEAATEAAEQLEKTMAGDEPEEEEEEEEERPARRSSKKKTSKKKRGSRKRDEEEEEEEEDDPPSAKDVINACRGALKVLEKPEVQKLLKKYGKATAPSKVPAQYRAKVLEKIEEALEE